MKKILNLMMAFTMAILATGFASCSKDGDPDPDAPGSGKMTGWVKIGDDTYDLNHSWYLPGDAAYDNEWTILAASKDIDSKKLIKDNFNLATITVEQKANGTWEYDIEFMVDFNYFSEDSYTGYWFGGTDATIEKNGDSFLIKADNVRMERYDSHGTPAGTVTGSFLFSGKPGTFKNTVIE